MERCTSIATYKKTGRYEIYPIALSFPFAAWDHRTRREGRSRIPDVILTG